MSSAPGVVKDIHNPAIDNLIQFSLESENKRLSLEWIPCSEITDIKSTPIDAVHYAIRKKTFNETLITLISLGNSEECTPTLVSEFARIYSLPTNKHNNDVNQFERHSDMAYGAQQTNKGF